MLASFDEAATLHFIKIALEFSYCIATVAAEPKRRPVLLPEAFTVAAELICLVGATAGDFCLTKIKLRFELLFTLLSFNIVLN